MKHFKSLLALVLALVMILSCVGTAFAAEKTEITELTKTAKTERAQKELKGFKSTSFKETNLYQYADDEQVRAIVVLKGAPEADVAERGSQKATNYRAKLAKQHNAVRSAMKGIAFTPVYDFTTLLNGFSCDVAYGDLEKIAAIDGVDAVYIANSYDAPELQEPTMESANSMTGNSLMPWFGIDGAGMVIAVLDTGTNTTHEAFKVYNEEYFANAALSEEDVALAVAKGQYLSAKIPFAYDYADKDDDVTDKNGHGSHVAGIATGYAEAKDGAITFSGASPFAQLLAMKIFHDDEGGTTSDIYFYAIEDAYRLGVDVVNMSIGSQNGFTFDSELETEVFGNMYERMDKAGVVMCIAAGNEYSMNYFSTKGYTGPEYTDYGTVASPATYSGNVSVASVENEEFPQAVIQVGEAYIPYTDSSDEKNAGTTNLWKKTFSKEDESGELLPLDYVIITDAEGKFSLGVAKDYDTENVKGKIAVVSRGEISFEEKMNFAAAAGAIGCIVVNNEEAVIGMSITKFTIPAISVKLSALKILKEGTQLTVPSELIVLDNPNGWLMSDFTNWGTSPDLTIDPAITSVGGNVYSSFYTGDEDYEVYSGTSMASPNAAGTFANVLCYLMQERPELSKVERAKLAKDLLEGTAEVLFDADNYVYSVRLQGAGLANSMYATQAISGSTYVKDPLKELGDDPEKTGVYSFDVDLVYDPHEEAEDSLYIDLYGVVMMDYIVDASDTEDPIYINTLTTDYFGEDADIDFSVDGTSVTSLEISRGETITVKVTITLSENVKAYFDKMFPNGTFVEGYIWFDDINPDTEYVYSSSHATYLAYYGDWTDGDVLEEADFRDAAEADIWLNTTAYDEEGNTYADYGYGIYDVLPVVTDFNTALLVDSEQEKALVYAGDNLLDYIEYNEKHISLSTPLSDGTYYYADLLYMVPYQLRNARHLIMTVSDAETGEVYYVDDTEYLPKAAFNEETGYWDAFGVFQWDGTDEYGDYVPSGTVAHVQYDAVLPYGDTEKEDCWSFDVTVDYTAPVIESVVYDAEAETLTVKASDSNYLAAIYLADADYEILDRYTYSSEEQGASFTATFDVSGLDADQVRVTALDYATNENEVIGSLFETGKDATVTLKTPDNEIKVNVKTGDSYIFPDCDEEYEGYLFEAWTTAEVEKSADGSDIEADFYYEGDEILVKEDITVYALYASGSVQPLETADYYVPSAYGDDFSGEWAIVGFNYGDESYIVDEPFALDDEFAPVDVVKDLGATVSDEYLEFFTNETSIRFLFEQTEDGYTLKNVKSGKYISIADGALAYVDAPDANAYWLLSETDVSSVLITNVAQADYILLYDDDKSEFALFDNSVVLFNLFGTDIYPSDFYNVYLYTCMTEDFVSDYYTTKVPVPVPGCDVSNFTDTPAKWYHEAIDYTVSQGLMKGISAKEFDPNGTMTRAMMVTVLYRMAGEPEVTVPCTFTDVPQGKFYSDAVAWAQENGIVLGVLADKFAPNDPVTREQIATILWRYAGSPKAEADLTGFSDAAKISTFAKDAMAWAVAEEIFQGDGGMLKPTDNATRAEFACIIMRYLGGSYECPNLK